MSDEIGSVNSTAARKKIEEAMAILADLDMPKGQQNERSALTLLSLLNLKPESTWKECQNPRLGITPMMDYFTRYYGKKYAANTRETVRRHTIHQFEQAGMVVANPDKRRAVNSPGFCA